MALLIALMMSSAKAYAQADALSLLSVPQTAGQSAGTDEISDSLIQEGRLASLETRYYGHTFASETTEKRLSRLEAITFGSRSNQTITERLDRLTRAADIEKVGAVKLPQTKAKPAPKEARPGNFRSYYNTAMRDISLKRYHAAAEGLLNAINLNPRHSLSYAYLGDVLIKLQDKPGALEAYRACFEVDPFGKYGRYGKSKLVAMSAQAAYEKTAPQDSPAVVARTIKLINRQSSDLGARYSTDWDHWSSWRSALAGISERRRHEDAHDRANNVYGNRGHGPYGGELSNSAMLNNAYARSDYMTQANRLRAESAYKAALVAQSAASLKEQMLQPQKPGSAKLRALGTNLYVRYYGSDTPSIAEVPVPEDPPLELKAIAAKLK